MSRPARLAAALTAAVTLLALASCLVVIDVTEYGVVTRFGRVVRVIREPGLYLKRPYPVDTVLRLDRRLLGFKPVSTEHLSQDKKNLVVHSLVAWRIADPERFLATVATRAAAEERLADVVLAAIGSVLGRFPSTALVSLGADRSGFDDAVGAILGETRRTAIAAYGVEVVDVRLRQIGLPEQNRANVFARMRAERGKIAMKHRSEGEREFRRIVSEADREKVRIMAEAYLEAERAKAEGDAEAMRIYADAFSRDPHFYRFLRMLQAYEKVLDGNTTLFLPSDAEVLQVLGGARRHGTGR